MTRFKVVERQNPTGTAQRFAVVDTQSNELPVAEFDTREAAQAHADRLAEGPFDWDEQEAWKDDWDDDDEA